VTPTAAVVVEQYWHRVPGGTVRATDETLRALVGLDGFEFAGVAAWHRSDPPVAPPIPTSQYRLPRPLLYEAWHRIGQPKLSCEADVIWAPAMVVPPRSAPLVVTVHDLDFIAHPERLSRRGRSFFPRAWQVTMDRADRIVCPSDATASQVRSQGVEAERVSTVPWGVDPTIATEDEIRSVRQRNQLPEQFALWVGTAEPRKNLGGLVDAFGRIDLPLVVAGPQGWVVDSRDLSAPLGARVHRLGVVNDSDLRSLYAAATVFVFPSLAEGFGLPVLEAMAQGTAVVTSAGTACEEAAGGAALLVDPTDPAAIAQAVTSVVENEDVRQDLENRGRGRAAARSWTETAIGYANVFDEVRQ